MNDDVVTAGIPWDRVEDPQPTPTDWGLRDSHLQEIRDYAAKLHLESSDLSWI